MSVQICLGNLWVKKFPLLIRFEDVLVKKQKSDIHFVLFLNIEGDLDVFRKAELFDI